MSRRLYARDTRGAEAADHDGSARSSAVAVAAPSPTTARHQPHVALMLGLQRTAGNQAVLGLLGVRSARHSLAPAHVVQRQDDDYEDAGSSWSGGEEAASSEYSSGESSGAGSEWSSGAADGGAEGGGGGEGGESWATNEAPTTESSGGDSGGSSEWSEGGGGESAGTEWSGGDGDGAGGGESAGSEWSSGGGGGSGGGGSEEQPAGDDGDGGSSWWPFGGGGEDAPAGDGDGGSSWWPFGGDEESGEDEGDHSADDVAAKEAEGQIGIISDPFVTTTGSPVHSMGGSGVGGLGGFHDGGRRGTVPFRDEGPEDHADGVPHAITTGGKTGTRVWAGGGGAGPKGNQKTGTYSKQVVPDYDTDWGGIATDASAWVIPGTGIFDVHRDYMSSDPGDQGNGWWISSAAASALEAHEQRHLEQARNVYASTIQPMLDRIAKSKSVGYRTNYRSSVAVALLQKYVAWESSIKRFESEDALWNADNGQVDTEDLMSPRYPVPMKNPKTIGGKDYEHYLIMPGEKPT